MKKFVKWMIGVSLFPLCWAVSRVFFSLLKSSLVESSGWSAWAIPIGFMISVGGFFTLPHALRTYVLGHELTHALSGVLMGAKVGKMKVGKNGGHVMLSKGNFFISLSPYFFPFYTAVVMAVWYAVGAFYDLRAYECWWLIVVGFTWGFHVIYTVYMLSQEQPDVQENGRIFSYVIIYLANVFFVVLWMVMVGSPTFFNAAGLFWTETGVVYRWVGRTMMAGWTWAQSLR